jgi:hypothetical protein
LHRAIVQLNNNAFEAGEISTEQLLTALRDEARKVDIQQILKTDK